MYRKMTIGLVCFVFISLLLLALGTTSCNCNPNCPTPTGSTSPGTPPGPVVVLGTPGFLSTEVAWNESHLMKHNQNAVVPGASHH